MAIFLFDISTTSGNHEDILVSMAIMRILRLLLKDTEVTAGIQEDTLVSKTTMAILWLLWSLKKP